MFFKGFWLQGLCLHTHTIHGKLNNREKEVIFVCYDYRLNGYRICTKEKTIIARTAKFIENSIQYSNNTTEEILNFETNIFDQTEHAEEKQNILR